MEKTKMLKKNYEFKKVLTKGKYFSGKYIECFILENNKKYNFIGLAISKKIGKAVIRNHIKRLIRENYKELELKIKEGYSIVFLVKKKVKVNQINFYKISEDMKIITQKAQLEKNK